jgi:hypothetical protein
MAATTSPACTSTTTSATFKPGRLSSSGKCCLKGENHETFAFYLLIEWENLYSNSVYLKYLFYRVYCEVNSASVLYHTIIELSAKFYLQVTQPLTVSAIQLMYTVKEKGGKPNRNAYPPPYGLRNPCRNLKSENSQYYARKPQQNCMLPAKCLPWFQKCLPLQYLQYM